MIEDLRDECTKFGAVVAVTVPRPPDAANAAAVFGTGNFGKVRRRNATWETSDYVNPGLRIEGSGCVSWRAGHGA